jgi:shikimate kinase
MKTLMQPKHLASVAAPKPVSRAIFLVGFMGAGKSAVGRVLADRLGWRFDDLDERIEAREQRPIAQIFRESEETAFRQSEHAALRQLITELEGGPGIVALGGGAFVQPDNLAVLQEAGAITVFLDGPVEELFLRCHGEPVERPLRGDERAFRELFEARRPAYMTASVRIETAGKTVMAVVDAIAGRLRLG